MKTATVNLLGQKELRFQFEHFNFENANGQAEYRFYKNYNLLAVVSANSLISIVIDDSSEASHVTPIEIAAPDSVGF